MYAGAYVAENINPLGLLFAALCLSGTKLRPNILKERSDQNKGHFLTQQPLYRLLPAYEFVLFFSFFVVICLNGGGDKSRQVVSCWL